VYLEEHLCKALNWNSLTYISQNIKGTLDTSNASQQALADGPAVLGEEVDDEAVDVLVAARHLPPQRLLDLVLLTTIRAPEKTS
jgi:hypothetical protein